MSVPEKAFMNANYAILRPSMDTDTLYEVKDCKLTMVVYYLICVHHIVDSHNYCFHLQVDLHEISELEELFIQCHL